MDYWNHSRCVGPHCGSAGGFLGEEEGRGKKGGAGADQATQGHDGAVAAGRLRCIGAGGFV